MSAKTGSGDGIARRVRAARERLGWTREALAFHAELSWSAVTQVESGRRTNLRPGTLAALAGALGVSIDYLVGGTPSRSMFHHSAFCYSNDDQFGTAMESFLAEGIERSEAVLAVTTAPNIDRLRERLGKQAREVRFVDSGDWYTAPIAALETYRTFADTKLKRGVPWVRIIGEPVWAGRTERQVRLWTRYESLLNLAFSAYPLTLVCPYDERSVPADIVQQAHLTHPHRLDDGAVAKSAGYTDPARFVLEPRSD
jgi:transcriptional regulator with XRE-family HTH domain